MTREKALERLNNTYTYWVGTEWGEVLKMAIKALKQEPCEDAISRKAIKEKKVYSRERHEYVVPVAEIDWMKPVTPQEPKTGHWMEHNTGHSTYYDCSRCGCVASCTEFADSFLWKLSNFCPDCGARMIKP